MTKKTRRKRESKIRKSEGNSLNLIPLQNTFLGFKLKNINQLWNWKTLEDVNFK